MIRAHVRAGLGACGLLAAAACATTIDGGSDVPPLYDAVWCDLQAVPCVAVTASTFGVSDYCAVPGLAPVPASPPGGRRTCFDSTKTTPEATCAALCAASATNGVVFPGGCTARVDTDATAHPRLGPGGYEAQACSAAMPYGGAVLSDVGTNIVDVAGAGSATYGGVRASVTVVGGRVVVEAPDTSCGSTLQDSCFVQLNQIDLTFADFSAGGLDASGLTLSLADPALLPSGSVVPSMPPTFPDPVFSFFVPGDAASFDAIGDVAVGALRRGGLPMEVTSVSSGTIDLVTGDVALRVAAQGTVAGEVFELDVVVTTRAVVDAPPSLVVPPIGAIDGGSGCMVQAALTAVATSPQGLPVTVTFAVDDGLPAVPGPTATTTLFDDGSHTIRVLAVDSLGVTATATTTVSTDPSCP